MDTTGSGSFLNNYFQKRQESVTLANSLSFNSNDFEDSGSGSSPTKSSIYSDDRENIDDLNLDMSSDEDDDPIENFEFSTKEGYTMLYSNLDSMRNKRSEILLRINRLKPDIICFTETRPKNAKYYNEADYYIPGYEQFFNENPKRGVMLFFRPFLNAKEFVGFKDFKFDESIFCSFTSGSGEKVLIGGIYRSPNSSIQNNKKLFDILKSDKTENFQKKIFVGDFNYPRVNFDGTWTGKANSEIYENINDAFLIQKVIHSTRHRKGQNPTRVDWVLVNDENLISNIQHLSPFGKSDHNVLAFQIYVSKAKEKESRNYSYNLSKGDYCKMRKLASNIDWVSIQSDEVDKSWNNVKEELHKLMDECIPKHKPNNFPKLKPIWMTKKALRKIKKKYKMFRRWLGTKSGYDYLRYIDARNASTREIKKAKKQYEKKVANECKTNPRTFWRYVQDKLKVKKGISVLKKPDGSYTNNDQEKAEVLNSFFASVFTREDTSNIPPLNEGERSNYTFISDIRVTPLAVKKKLDNLNPNKSQGPDRVPARVLRELSASISGPLSFIFNLSLEKGCVPSDWKKAEVSSIFKKGCRSDPGNYRPVSLTCIVCKVLESLVRDCVVSYFDDNDLFSPCQYGFRSKRSCAVQLLVVMEKFTKWIDEGSPFDVIYLDFSKAFDSVPHGRLLEKLKSYGVVGNLLNWIKSFLTDRSQTVKVGDAKSSEQAVLSGIPQGSILGPILFLIFINDLPDGLESFCQIFADDTKVYSSVQNSDSIQNDLYKLQDWTERWNLHFNVKKCKVLHYGKNNPNISYKMKLGNDLVNVDSCNEEKDLGVSFDTDLNFDGHINRVVSKANQMLGIIKRSFEFLDKDIFLKLYKSLIRPHLEYANSVWCPYLKRQSVSIEKVQRRATKLIPGCEGMTYIQRLKYLNLHSLKGRRIRGDLIETFKIFNGFTNINTNNLFILSNDTRTRNREHKIFIQHCNTNRRKFSFGHRVAITWNDLPNSFKCAKTINQFKNFLDSCQKLQSKFYDYDG